MNRYEVFVRVVECGSFTRAARELNYTQSAVSQMVHTLEEELSAALVLRSKGGVRLTADGEAYYPFICAISNAHRALEEKHRAMQGLTGGKVRIGSITSVSRNWLPGLMNRFRQRYPAVQFELFQGDYNSIGQWVREGKADFGFICPEAVSGLESTPLYKDEMVAVLPEGHPLAARETVTLRELASCPNILLDEGELSIPLKAYEEAGVRPDVHYRVYDDYSVMTMVEQGLGVAMLYRAVVEGQGRCVIRPLSPAVERTVAVVCRNRRTLPAASRNFLEFLLRTFAHREKSGKNDGNPEAGVTFLPSPLDFSNVVN
ncbi:LysR family transcriptional regulator [Dysosmobacter sp.]|uniref:LysR family transcriptional regulator n=1 Tax=Dysosmobacter sp. TaxID=2591382 RepID=UPI002A8D8575|nr:LysR family transcriptional regulator [Dysosmobacter sp.]MDY3281576.1 LysR family transcriptional regulator [Dysosmobacter sp.]